MRSFVFVAALSLVGALIGYFYAGYRIARMVAYARETLGWVCGTGLEIPYYVWTPFGLLVGLGLGLLIIGTFKRALRFQGPAI